ncbi:MAG TPA: vWA domain-containing protein [Spirochaetota bacterium]|nr:vWA domain-containing protein [Spirochaetota bacterium]HPC41356.1 vWA domain-containing protein [Spirochaetota bacterium]HPL15451.1 vWA domain-containing protein [Spirochaetota bacterium]HQF09713.1 vWA domain-containing protein [Spirochaetota bacterium]HQH99453.1 vWA domain-containing protein [Spirochaetota bacterium]
MGRKLCNAILPLLLLLVVAQFTLAAKDCVARQSKDIIMVLDTSMSMIGRAGGKDILNDVKRSISDYIDQVEDGDRVTFVTFDTDVRIYPTVIVDDDNDRDILKKYITMTDATGLWTNTFKMITKVLESAENLDKKDGRQTEIVIMTDAIDDPSPGDKKFDFVEFAKKYGKKSKLWVYVLSFSPGMKSENAKKMEKELGLVSDNVKVIQAGDPEKGKQELIQDEKERESAGRSILIPIIIAGACILLVLAILFLVKRLADLKVAGKLEYWNNEIIEPYMQYFDLARRPAREVMIGKGLGCVVNVRDITIKKPVMIKAIRHEGAVRMKLIDNENARVEMVNRQADGLLQDGDIFKVGNYTFKYFAS